MNKRILIIGGHPLAKTIIRQFQEVCAETLHLPMLTTEGGNINEFDQLYLLPKKGEECKSLALLAKLAAAYDVASHSGVKLLCHLMMPSVGTLRMLQTTDFCDSVRQKIDVYPFTMEEVWIRSIVLDYEAITIHSNKHVHLVIFGMDEVAETVAMQAAHIAHYPNYVRDYSLRTRITMISENAEELSGEFIKKYRYLFDNSYYRIVNPSEENAVKVFHKPMYEGRREDFADVEWEFVDAESWHPDVREKLKQWAQDDKQLLTVVMADGDENKNVAMSLFLPDELYQRSIPIHKYNPNAVEYDVTMPLVQMAKNINYIYDRCYNDNFENWQGEILSSVEIDTEERERLWDKLSNIKRQSSIYNAMTIPSKMRSIGLNENDWDKFYDISQHDIEILAQVEHNRWNVEKLLMGYRKARPKEDKFAHPEFADDLTKNKKLFIHHDIRPFEQLDIIKELDYEFSRYIPWIMRMTESN